MRRFLSIALAGAILAVAGFTLASELGTRADAATPTTATTATTTNDHHGHDAGTGPDDHDGRRNGGGRDDERGRLAADRDRGPARHRLHRARRPHRRDRSGALGRRRHARARLRLRARSGRAALRRDADHRRRDLGGGRDAGGRRRRLHGPDRQPGASREAEVDQHRRAVRLLPALHPHGDEQHLLLDHPGDQRGCVREQDPARACTFLVHRCVRAGHHVEPGCCRDGDHPAPRGGRGLHPRRRSPDHDPRQHRRDHRHVARDRPTRTRARRQPRATGDGSRPARCIRRRPRAQSSFSGTRNGASRSSSVRCL